jgi:hypothetical protein
MTSTPVVGRRALLSAAVAVLTSTTILNAPARGSEVTTNSLSQCTSGYMCVWSGATYTGTLQKFSSTGSYKSVSLSSINSLYNHRSDRSYVHEQSDGSGVFACYNPGQKSANVSGWIESAEAVYLSTSASC